MKKALIVLFFSFLVQLNAFADATSTFMETPTGANLLNLIDDSKDSDKTRGEMCGGTQVTSFMYLHGYLIGITNSTEYINKSVIKLAN